MEPAGLVGASTAMTWDDETTAARGVLLGLRGKDGGWGYRRGSASRAEPTALAGLALLATGNRRGRGRPRRRARQLAKAAADWLASVQRPDGSVGVSASTPTPGWMTPYAILFWNALGVHEGRGRSAGDWLLGQKGRTLDRADDPKRIAGHDTTLVGWPWVDDTHSWLEPTAMAVLALGRLGLGDHPRVREGLRLIRDRAVVSGGWNYGNTSVFGRPLRPQPAPTGLALLALAGTGPRTEEIGRAAGYLAAALPGVRASASLGWGLVGLRAWGEVPAGSASWLSEAIAGVVRRPDAAPKLACLLLALGGRTLELLDGTGRADAPVVSNGFQKSPMTDPDDRVTAVRTRLFNFRPGRSRSSQRCSSVIGHRSSVIGHRSSSIWFLYRTLDPTKCVDRASTSLLRPGGLSMGVRTRSPSGGGPSSPGAMPWPRPAWGRRPGATTTSRGLRAEVFVSRASSYDVDLERPIADGLRALGLAPAWAEGKSVLLKPNLVEPSREAPHINTHPAVVRAAAEVFRRWGAREVVVGEGQGHCRDTEYVLEQSGLGRVLDEAGLDFIDLNHDDVWTTANRLRFTTLRRLCAARWPLRRADLIVSMPKMKTHHWAGVTLSMKNLFGVMPGVVYGWPKNVLHHAGIPESILDINAAVRPHLAIVDGIIAMEGDGPIMGTPRAAGLLVVGTNPAAVDATCTRLMGLDPWRISYLSAAAGLLGPISRSHIAQRGETIESSAQKFAVVDVG